MCDKCPASITIFQEKTIPLPFEKVLLLFAQKTSDNPSSTQSIVKENNAYRSTREWKIHGTSIRGEIEFNVRHDEIVVVFATPPGCRMKIYGIYAAEVLGEAPETQSTPSAVAIRNAPVSVTDGSTPISALSEALKKSSRRILSPLTTQPHETGFPLLKGSMEARFEKADLETNALFEANFDSEILDSEKLIEFASRLIDSTYRFSLK